MHRFGIEEEFWFEATRTALEQRGFRMRVQPRSIVLEKEGRLPRLLSGAREFLEFAERQGIHNSAAAWEAADRYGDVRSDFSGRATPSPFETPPAGGGAGGKASVQLRHPETEMLERLAELRREEDRLAQERRLANDLLQEKRRLEERCAELESERDSLQAEVAQLTQLAAEAAVEKAHLQAAAAQAEEQLRLLQAGMEAAPAGKTNGGDKRFDQLRRFLARELHPDLAGENMVERELREALFKRVWARIEALQ